MKGKLYSIVTALRSQIQDKVDGTANYYYNLRDKQVLSEFVLMTEARVFPLVCIASATEDLVPITINTVGGSGVSTFVPSWEMELFGYVKADSSEVALPECLKLLSDVENAILEDDSLSSGVTGLTLRSSTGNYERFGVFHLVLSGGYSGR